MVIMFCGDGDDGCDYNYDDDGNGGCDGDVDDGNGGGVNVVAMFTSHPQVQQPA